MTTLTKDMLADKIHERVGLAARDAREALETILELIKTSLEEGREVKISGFGKWCVREKKARPGRNPHSGEAIEISARRVVTFHPSDKLRESIVAGGEA